jgi:hypothetical protein
MRPWTVWIFGCNPETDTAPAMLPDGHKGADRTHFCCRHPQPLPACGIQICVPGPPGASCFLTMDSSHATKPLRTDDLCASWEGTKPVFQVQANTWSGESSACVCPGGVQPHRLTTSEHKTSLPGVGRNQDSKIPRALGVWACAEHLDTVPVMHTGKGLKPHHSI